MAGPLQGVKVLEFAGIGPGPFAAMMLADMGADVIRIDRADRVRGGDPNDPPKDILNRGRRSLAVNLKSPDAVEAVLKLVEQADVVLEGFRPGVMERLGLGPDVCRERNPGIVYGRMTGWGQEGPMAQAAGHDINYIALAGALDGIRRKGEKPLSPLNLVGDFGGGGMFLVVGVLAALVERSQSGKGQVVDAAMVDGASTLMAFFHGMRAMGAWDDGDPGNNLLDSGAHFYDTYETKDGKYVSVGSIEPQFYALLLEHTGLAGEELPHQMDKSQWPGLKDRVTEIFKQKTRDEWCEIMEGTDICFAPVLTMTEAREHPHIKARNTFVPVDGHPGAQQAAPAPRFSRSRCEIQGPPPAAGQQTDSVLAEYGFAPDEITTLKSTKAIA